jgi:putative ABC transport system substrate-binding protein
VAAKGATETIPIVFTTARDPVAAGLVTSLNRPSGNLTGVSFIFGELVAKRLQLLTELLPAAKSIAMLVNPSDSTLSESNVRATEEAARVLGLRVYLLKARREAEFDEAFAALIRQGAAALLVDANAFFNSERERIVALASRYRVPAIYQGREFTDAGGLLSYGPRLVEGFRQVGLYVGKILSGAKPGDLPVIQLSKVELVVNLTTAKTLGITIPQSILARADEVIE